MKDYMALMGMPAKDRVSGYAGVVTSISFDLYGCVQVAISPKAKAGVLEHGHWFDHKRVVITGKKPVMTPPTYAAWAPGDEPGPAAKPAQRTEVVTGYLPAR